MLDIRMFIILIGDSVTRAELHGSKEVYASTVDINVINCNYITK